MDQSWVADYNDSTVLLFYSRVLIVNLQKLLSHLSLITSLQTETKDSNLSTTTDKDSTVLSLSNIRDISSKILRFISIGCSTCVALHYRHSRNCNFFHFNDLSFWERISFHNTFNRRILLKRLIMKLFSFAFSVCLAIFVAIPISSQDLSLLELIQSDTELGTFYDALLSAKYTDLFESDLFIAHTVFAPINTAFAELDQTYLTKLLTAPYIEHLTILLAMHVVKADIPFSDLTNGLELTTLNTENITVVVDSNDVALNSPKAEGSLIVANNLYADLGLVHKVNGILLPGYIGTTLMDTINNDPQFSILAELFELVGSANLIPEDSEVTVLAPTDDALSAKGQNFLNYLRDPANSLYLLSFLTVHILPGIYPAQNLVTGQVLSTTFSSTNVTVKFVGTEVYFDDAQVVKGNILSSSGIVHAVDNFLSEIPAEVEISDTPMEGSPAASPTTMTSLSPLIKLSIMTTVVSRIFWTIMIFMPIY